MSKYKGSYKNELDEDVVETPVEEAAPEEQLTPEEETFKKRYSDLRRHMQDMKDKAEKDKKELQDQLNAATKKQIKFPKTEEEIKEWEKKYPDVAAIIDTIAQRRVLEASTSVDERLGKLKEIETRLDKERAFNELKRLHPDFDEIRADPAFHEWVADQSQNVQDALYKNETDYKWAAEAIDLYKLKTGYGKNKPKTSPKDAARPVSKSAPYNPDGEGKATYSESKVQAMSSRDYDQHEEAIKEAIRTGKFEYDLTGGAR